MVILIHAFTSLCVNAQTCNEFVKKTLVNDNVASYCIGSVTDMYPYPLSIAPLYVFLDKSYKMSRARFGRDKYIIFFKNGESVVAIYNFSRRRLCRSFCNYIIENKNYIYSQIVDSIPIMAIAEMQDSSYVWVSRHSHYLVFMIENSIENCINVKYQFGNVIVEDKNVGED